MQDPDTWSRATVSTIASSSCGDGTKTLRIKPSSPVSRRITELSCLTYGVQSSALNLSVTLTKLQRLN